MNANYKIVSNQVYLEGRRSSFVLSKYPTPSEKKLIEALTKHHIRFKFHRCFYKSFEGRKDFCAYYIAQFWLPKKKLILNVTQEDRECNPRYTSLRSFDSSEVYPKAQYLEVSKEDINTPLFIDELVRLLK